VGARSAASLPGGPWPYVGRLVRAVVGPLVVTATRLPGRLALCANCSGACGWRAVDHRAGGGALTAPGGRRAGERADARHLFLPRLIVVFFAGLVVVPSHERWVEVSELARPDAA
jgi:hypothetical protein